MRSAFMLLVSIMWWMKLQEIIRSDVYLVQNKVRILSCRCHGWSVRVLPLVPRVALYGLCRTSTCPIQNLLSKFCFSIKAEAVVYGHYSGNSRSRQECNIIVLSFATDTVLMVICIKKLLNFIMQQKKLYICLLLHNFV